jgi:hypothetical protein
VTLLLVLLFAALALALLSGDWRLGLLLTVVIGFAQDPIRKLTPGQPGLYVGLALVAFAASAFVLWQRRQGRFELPLMFPATPALRSWLPAFAVLIALQALHAFARWGGPTRTLIGVGFYLAPLIGIWVGFQLGRFQPFLRQLLQLYLFGVAVFGFTALLDYLGTQTPLFDAVGGGQLIHFRYGYFTTGAIGLWRSTDMAAMHLTAGACLAMVFALSGSAGLQRTAWLALSGLFALTSLLTGRRKAIVQVVVFVGLFFWLLARYGPTRSRQQLFGVAISAAGLAALVFLIDPSEFLGDEFGEYVDRAATAPGDIWERFNVLGLSAFLRGLEISNGIGVGVGTLAQTGDAGVAAVSGAGFAYVSESGLGKVTAELGVPGILLLLLLGSGFFAAVRHDLRLMRYLPLSISVFEIGLLAFALSNLPFFSAAAGVYGDPFVLILCGICFGSVFAVPSLLAQRPRVVQTPGPVPRPAFAASADG